MKKHKNHVIKESQALRIFSQLLDVNKEWNLLQEYCVLKDNGLKKAWKKKIDEFREYIFGRPLENQILFVSWFKKTLYENKDLEVVNNYKIENEIVKPVLDLWMKNEPNNSEPYRWLGTLESLRKAIEIDENEVISKDLILNKVIFQVKMSQHELEQFFHLGNPSEELDLLNFVMPFINIYGREKQIELLDEVNARIFITEIWMELETAEKNPIGKFPQWVEKHYPEFEYEKYV